MTFALYTNCAWFCVVLAATLFASSVTRAPKAEETGHHQFHDSHYRHWKQPGTNISCCSDDDCAPVTAELRHGKWFAMRQGGWFTPLDWFGSAEWLPLRQSEWIAVPDEKIIQVPNPTIEGAHLCYLEDRVVCFVPPNTGG
jgi:hypothetical protein